MSFQDYRTPETPGKQAKSRGHLSLVPNPGPELEIIQWNVFHGSPIEPVLENIAGADIVTLQEAAYERPKYHDDDGILKAVQKETDFKHVVWAHSHDLIPREEPYAGKIAVKDAILIGSKYPILSERVEVLSENEAHDLDHDGKRRVPYLEASIETHKNGPLLTMATTHRTIPLLENIRNGVLMRETSRMNQVIEEAGDNLVLTGDFNAPWFMGHIRKTHASLQRVNGRLARKTVRPPKFKGMQLPQMRVDYVYVNPDTIRVLGASVTNPHNNPSDHNILTVTLQQTG